MTMTKEGLRGIKLNGLPRGNEWEFSANNLDLNPERYALYCDDLSRAGETIQSLVVLLKDQGMDSTVKDDWRFASALRFKGIGDNLAVVFTNRFKDGWSDRPLPLDFLKPGIGRNLGPVSFESLEPINDILGPTGTCAYNTYWGFNSVKIPVQEGRIFKLTKDVEIFQEGVMAFRVNLWPVSEVEKLVRDDIEKAAIEYADKINPLEARLAHLKQYSSMPQRSLY